MTETKRKVEAFPGGIGVTHLRVYEEVASLERDPNEAKVFEIPVDPEREERRPGMCGAFRPYLPEGELM
jgi:hypothetical protein